MNLFSVDWLKNSTAIMYLFGIIGSVYYIGRSVERKIIEVSSEQKRSVWLCKSVVIVNSVLMFRQWR